jgi:hypothetical protein
VVASTVVAEGAAIVKKQAEASEAADDSFSAALLLVAEVLGCRGVVASYGAAGALNKNAW